jgi:ketosteroid isomerase-like protein
MKTRCVVSLMVLAAFMLISQPAKADDLADLKAAHMKLVKAVNTGDMETLFEMIVDRPIRFGAMHAFPQVMRDKVLGKQFYTKFFETHVYRARWYKPDYRVIGNTGLVWGNMEETRINKKGGPTQRWLLKVSQVFVKVDGKWKGVLIHYTPIPSSPQTSY